MERAIQLTQFPKTVGLYKSEEIQVNIGKYGYYMRPMVKITQLKITKTFRKDAKKIIDGTFQKKSNVIKEFERV